jgi:hypothetical protein
MSAQMTSTGSSSMVILRGIDLDTSIEPYLAKCEEFDFFMRYCKNYSPAEHAAIKARGKHTGLIWETTADRALQGGAAGTYDGNAFIAMCSPGGRLEGIVPTGKSALFPALDDSPSSEGWMNVAGNYWYMMDTVLFKHSWLIGAYAPGVMLDQLIEQKVNYCWVPGAMGWEGSRSFVAVTPPKWDIIQGPPMAHGGTWPPAGLVPGVEPMEWPDIGVEYDPNIARSLDWAL